MTEGGAMVTLTISKLNHKPYVSDITVTGTCSFPPAVVTNAATAVLETTATLNGEITSDFGEVVTESGFVYSTTSDPVIGGGGVTQIQTDPIVTSGAFAEDISGLSAITRYYFRAS